MPGVSVAGRASGRWGLRVTSRCPPAGPSRPTVRGPRRHPPVLRMVLEALQAGEQRRGTSVAAIKVHILQKYPTVDVLRLKYLLKQALATGVRRGLLVRPPNSKARGATGSFKVSLLRCGVGGGHGVGGTGPRSLSFSPSPPSPARGLASPPPASLSSSCLLGDALSSRCAMRAFSVPRCVGLLPCHVCPLTGDYLSRVHAESLVPTAPTWNPHHGQGTPDHGH